MQLYRLFATCRGPSQKKRDYTDSPAAAEAIRRSVFLEQARKAGERVVGRLGDARSAGGAFAEILLVGVARMLVVVAVQAYLTVSSNGMPRR